MPAEFSSDVPSMPVAGSPEKGMGRREVRALGVTCLEFCHPNEDEVDFTSRKRWERKLRRSKARLTGRGVCRREIESYHPNGG